MSIAGSNNPFACSPVVFANANSIVSLGTITRDGNQFTFSIGFVWKINGVTYQNTAPVVLTISEASEGFQRIDNALLNTSNTIELQQGLESETIALQPIAPDTSIVLTSWDISGATIEDTETPILGTQFKKKTESLSFGDTTTTGANAVIPLRPNGSSYYVFYNDLLESIAGFDLSLITGNVNADVPYPGKDLIIANNTANPITLVHDGAAEVNFFFLDEVDLIIPAGERVWLRYGGSSCELLFKSWSDGGKRTQLIHDCSGWQLNTALNFVTVSAASGASWNLTNTLKNTTPGNTTNAVALIENNMTTPLAVVAYHSKLKKLTLESRFSYYAPNHRYLIGYFTKVDSIHHLTPTVLFDELIEYGNNTDGLYQQIEINSDIEIPAGALLVYAIASNYSVSSTVVQRFYALHTLIQLEEI